jgi:adenylate cyclase
MSVEIERKFLIVGDGYKENAEATKIQQGYLSKDPERTVRIRVRGDEGYITVKGKTRGASRAEYEYNIPSKDAAQLIKMCLQPLVEKTRYVVEHAGMTWEVDEFSGDNQGLVVAEIELESEDQKFPLPDWVGDEVTQDPRYYNSQLSSFPYKDWR